QAYRGAAIVLNQPAGFRIDHLLVATFDPSLARYSPPQIEEFYRKLLDRSRALPGVTSAALTSDVPMGVNGGAHRIVPEGVTLPPGTEAVLVLSENVTDGFFETMGVPIVEGRGFQVADRSDTPRVAVVNEEYAKRYYPKQSLLGKRFRLDGPTGAL